MSKAAAKSNTKAPVVPVLEPEPEPALIDLDQLLRSDENKKEKTLRIKPVKLFSIDPLEKISVDPRDVTELYVLNKTGIQEIHKNISKLVNLEVLWLNDNKLTAVVNLEQCFRIKHLYAQRNKIETIELDKQSFLQTLHLNNNLLRDLDVILSKLQHLKFLDNINLFGNPIAEETNYRLKVVFTFPKLKILDRHVVTQQERELAESMFGKASLIAQSRGDSASRTKIAFGAKVPNEVLNHTIEKVSEISVAVQQLHEEVKKIRREMNAKPVVKTPTHAEIAMETIKKLYPNSIPVKPTERYCVQLAIIHELLSQEQLKVLLDSFPKAGSEIVRWQQACDVLEQFFDIKSLVNLQANSSTLMTLPKHPGAVPSAVQNQLIEKAFVKVLMLFYQRFKVKERELELYLFQEKQEKRIRATITDEKELKIRFFDRLSPTELQDFTKKFHEKDIQNLNALKALGDLHWQDISHFISDTISIEESMSAAELRVLRRKKDITRYDFFQLLCDLNIEYYYLLANNISSLLFAAPNQESIPSPSVQSKEDIKNTAKKGASTGRTPSKTSKPATALKAVNALRTSNVQTQEQQKIEFEGKQSLEYCGFAMQWQKQKEEVERQSRVKRKGDEMDALNNNKRTDAIRGFYNNQNLNI